MFDKRQKLQQSDFKTQAAPGGSDCGRIDEMNAHPQVLVNGVVWFCSYSCIDMQSCR